MIQHILRQWFPFILLVVLMALFFYFRLDNYLSFTSLQANQMVLSSWTTEHYVKSVFLFISCYTLAVALSIPGAIFLTLTGGFLFGIVWGTVFVVISATLGATILFCIVRMSLGNWLANSASSWVERMRYGFLNNAFYYLLTLRLAPVFPFWIVNIVPALLGVNAKTFIAATSLGIIPGSIVYVSLGSGLGHFFISNQSVNLNILLSPEIFFPLTALAMFSLIPVIHKKRQNHHQIQDTNATTLCDIAIIGGGASGLSVAAVAAQLGLNIILIESENMGGDCLNYGCIPSKALLAAAKQAYQLSHSTQFGINAKEISIDFLKVLKYVQSVIDTIAKHDSVERFESLGVKVIKQQVCFVDAKTIKAGNLMIQAKHVVIATGSSPFIPPISGLDQVSYLTNETIFKLDEQPKHLIVLGGGPMGCELAQAFAMLNSKVTLISEQTILPQEDSDCVAILRQQLQDMGVNLYEEHCLQYVTRDDSYRINLSIQAIKKQAKPFIINGSHLLIAAGRYANVRHLDLEKAGIRYSNKGIEVNAYLQTSNKKIYAMGDVVGPYRFTHMASYHAGIIVRNIIFKLRSKVNYQVVPWVTFTDPEIAHAGLSLTEALNHNDLKIIERPYIDNDRAQTEQALCGKIKVVINKKARILGVTIVGRHAGELILPWIIAIRDHKTLRNFTDVIIPYPTISEISKQVASDYYKPQLFSDNTRKLIRFLNKLG